ncbi:MAG: calcium/sodium antiporter [Candidatus Hydrogenedentes bacterium]|nr:calcium/sodium antiporter [Candidatus Hydrogenedentota bacterium]
MIAFAWLILGLVVLTAGAEVTVRGASRLALLAGLSPLVIGLTVVAFGTSSPEMAVGVRSVLAGQSDLVVGNAVGSNIFNTLFILGISALIAPLLVSAQLIRLDVPAMIGAALLALLAALDGTLSFWEGALGIALLAGYTVFTVRTGKLEQAPESPVAVARGGRAWAASLLTLFAGLVLLTLGSDWLVYGATVLARMAGVSELIIGLTIVAIGTSLPEVATSVMATIRGERDIAVGNVVGSNTFNMLGVLGFSALVSGGSIAVPPDALAFDFPVMFTVSLLCLPIFVTGAIISRFEGGLFLCYYLIYMAVLFINTMNPTWLPSPGLMAGYLLVPAAIILFVDSLWSSGKGIRAMEQVLWESLDQSFRQVIKHTRRVVVVITGFTVLFVGIAMLVLPGPAFVVIPFGLFLLGTEFVWAKRLLERVHNQLKSAAAAARDWSTKE